MITTTTRQQKNCKKISDFSTQGASMLSTTILRHICRPPSFEWFALVGPVIATGRGPCSEGRVSRRS